ncbi:MAG: NADH-quinone oxidoreductase subunit NuoE [Acidimicrobiales bacterium]
MPRLSDASLEIAAEILARYPIPKSALIPLLHLAQEQDGYVSAEAMTHISELVGATPAEVLGTASFYEMFKFEPIGRYLVNICTNISCQLLGAEELLHHAERSLGVRPGGTTADGLFTLEDVECIAACTEAPCLQINYRYFYEVDPAAFDEIVADLRAGRRPTRCVAPTHDGDIPPHGALARIRQHLPAERRAGNAAPVGASEPAWLAANAEAEA